MDDRTIISLREITATNRREVERLGVTSDQENYVVGVAESLMEAAATRRPLRGIAPSTPGASPSASS